MDIVRSLRVSASGLEAQRTRMDAVAENLANADSVTAAGGRPYRRKLVYLETVPAHTFAAEFGARSGQTPGGVRVSNVAESLEPPRRVWQPDHPLAGADGFVNLPNVNTLKEMIDMMLSTRAYEANATAFSATKAMSSRLLEILR
jgi:flagellar basal-body rod protein FlgC